MSDPAILSSRALVKRFGGFTALHGIDFDLMDRERVGLIGPNGSGKSTFVNCLTGALRCEEGQVTFSGADITAMPAWRRAHAGLARSFQIPRPFRGLTVRQNIGVPLSFIAGMSDQADIDARADEVLAQVGLLAKAAQSPKSLSQVELRKLELGRAMAARPRVLIADESMAGLSDSEVDEILDVLMLLNESGIAIILIEHIMRAVVRFSQRLVVFVAGAKIADGEPREVMQHPEVVRAYLGNSLTIEAIDAGYGAVRVLSGVSVRVGGGETVALLGTNGNGKTTLMRCITGQIVPTRGSISAEIDGTTHNLIGLSTEQIVDLGISLVPEGRRLFPKLTVEENLDLGAYRKTARARIKQNLEFCYDAFPRLKERRGQLAGSMSGGEQQMLALGRALMASPRILLIDEPSVGLAPILVARVIDKIAELSAALGLTVLMAEQNFEQAARIANRGYVLVHGQVELAADSVADLRKSDVVRRLYLGTD